jgi:hypothetical protein
MSAGMSINQYIWGGDIVLESGRQAAFLQGLKNCQLFAVCVCYGGYIARQPVDA